MMQQSDMLLGLWQWILDPDVTELIGAAGFDYILLDMEHTARNIESARACMLAAFAADIPMVVRVTERDQQFMVEQMLEAGAQGILVPMVETKAQALNVVRYAKFPPEGVRGISNFVPVRRWLGTGNDPVFRAKANEKVFVSVILESPLALRNLDDLLTVDGIDAWMVGPGDLSSILGRAYTDPEIVEMVEAAFRRIGAAGKVGWAPLPSTDPVWLRSLGGKMVLLGHDFAAISGTQALVAAARTALAQKSA